MIEFKKISRWLYRSESYSISAVTTSPHGRWRVARDGFALGFAGDLEAAKNIANDDDELEARKVRAAQMMAAEDGYLTGSHVHAIMVPEARNDERITSVTETFNTCQCFSNYTEEELDGKTVRVFTSCGSTIPRKRTFKAGHDAKYKSVLQWAFRAGVPFIYVDGGVRTEADPVKLAKERGWGHFMTAKPKKAKKTSKADGKDNTGVDHADDQPDVEERSGFHPARVKVGRWWKDGNIVSEDRAANTITVSYKDKKGEHEITLNKNDEKLELE